MEKVNEGKEECCHVSIDAPSKRDKTLEQKMDELSPLSSKRSIYRVPTQLRQGNEKAFTSQVVSIGPLHHNNEELKCMEEQKIRFLEKFLTRNNVPLGNCIQIVKGKEQQLRNCYADDPFKEFDSDKFVEIILVDAVFSIELLLTSYFPELREADDDYIFHRPWKQWDIRYDLLLLENQLPFSIIKELLALVKSDLPQENDVTPSAVRLTYEFFSRTVYLMHAGNLDVEKKLYCRGIKHFVDFVRSYLPLSNTTNTKRLQSFRVPNVTSLHQAGITFKAGDEDKNQFEIKFDNARGILEIRRLLIYDTTENFLRYRSAYERCHLGFSENLFQ